MGVLKTIVLGAVGVALAVTLGATLGAAARRPVVPPRPVELSGTVDGQSASDGDAWSFGGTDAAEARTDDVAPASPGGCGGSPSAGTPGSAPARADYF